MPTLPIEPAPFKQFFRPAVVLSFFVGTGPVPVFSLPDLTGDGLRIEWEIDMTRTPEPDKGVFQIYNLNLPSRELLHNQWKSSSVVPLTAPFVGPLVSLRAQIDLGWDSVAVPLYNGDVWSIEPSRRVGVDIVTRIDSGAGNQNLNQLVERQPKAFSKGTTLPLIVQYLASQLGYTIDSASLALIGERSLQISLQDWNNYTYNPDLYETMNDLMATLDLEWKIYQGRIIVMQEGVAGITDRPTAPLISPYTGLLEWSTLDDQGVLFTALAHPRVVPGVQVAIQDSFGVPIGAPRHRVSRVRFTGSNYGESLMQVEARRANLL